MVQTLAINAQNDIYINSSGNIVMLSGIEAIAQCCQTACMTQLSECVLQKGLGLPNFQTVWNGVPDLAIWESYLQNTILAVSGVTQVYSVNITVGNNQLNFVAKINTIYGSTTISG